MFYKILDWTCAVLMVATLAILLSFGIMLMWNSIFTTVFGLPPLGIGGGFSILVIVLIIRVWRQN